MNVSCPRAEIILQGIRPTINHDLPNLTIALQGLLQILQFEEKDNMTAQGRQYLTRLTSLVGQIQTTLSLLKAISKVGSSQTVPDKVSLKEALQEALAAAKQGNPNRTICLFAEPLDLAITTSPTLLQQALVLILSLLADDSTQQTLDCHVSFRKKEHWLELLFQDHAFSRKSPLPKEDEVGAHHDYQGSCGTSSAPDRLNFEILSPDNRLRLLLLDELIYSCGGQVQVHVDASGKCFELRLPLDEAKVS